MDENKTAPVTIGRLTENCNGSIICPEVALAIHKLAILEDAIERGEMVYISQNSSTL